jgi:hypothetical protein
MPDAISRIAADNVRLARSRTLLDLVDGTYNLIRIPKFAFVDEVYLWITTAYSGGSGGAVEVGFSGNGETADPNGFMDATQAGGRATGMKRATGDTEPGSQGKWFQTASGMLTLTLAKGDDSTLITGWIFMRYYVLH